ncbi:MAG: hypothetical protein ACOCR0_00525 [Haloferacaceae archaeon]
MSEAETTPEVTGYERWQVYVSAIVAVVVSAAVTWYVSGLPRSVEQVFRVSPTVEGQGVGTDWLVGNTIPVLDFLIALIHAADVIMGVFILVMVFIHWAAFRRLADRMRQPGQDADAVAADGGEQR